MTPRTALACLLLFLLLPAAPLRADEATFDRWYAVTLAGQRVGHMHSTERRTGDRVTTVETMHLALRRGAATVEVGQSMSFTETAAGKPVEAQVTMKIADQPMASRYTFTDAGVEVVRQSGGRSITEHLAPVPGEYYTPAAANDYIRQRIAAGDERIAVAVLDVSGGTPAVMGMAMDRVGEQAVEVLGKTVPAVAWDMTVSNVPGMVMRQYLDDEGRMLRMSLQLMGMTLEVVAADEALATSPVDPPELMAASMVRPTGEPLNRPRQLRRAVYRLTLPAGYEGDLLRAGYQRVTWADQRTAVVAVDLDEPVNPAGDEAKPEHLAASTMLDHDDEAVRRLVADALGEEGERLSAAPKAERLRAYVHRFVSSKNLSVGFATAGEVARTAEGDCSEHAVLLAAMLRAAGVPSRTVTGLIYIDQFLGHERVFGFHMWAQAWVAPDAGDGEAAARWVDLDATLESTFDAAHIALAPSALGEGALVNDLVEVLPLLSDLRIEVLEAR